ncbi:hypothetical protein QR692_08755 [Lactococcus petauri]|uniref:hypothetical protein n=1 Tax=Lactococcus petauri TaxID=1940789 RepID=UPI0020791197|nr:hypothetical protein [Lactococcus petauri]USI67590.1 hypothetical protein LMK04_08850 [Lactococcus petauri]WJE12251.1 hypothetical protein QR692_08755 [Lactococcus petauri]
MKKIILSAVLCGGIFVASSSMLTAHADDTLTGTTAVSSEVTKGDVTLKIDTTTDFGQQPLSAVVDFGTTDVNYTVTDYSGDVKGFTIAAKLADTDSKRSLKIGEVELSGTAASVVTTDTNVVGDNTNKVSAALKYTGVEKVQKYASSIEWSLTKGTTRQIAE